MNLSPRQCLTEIFQAAIDAVAPGPALLRHLSVEGNTIIAGGRSFAIPENGIYVNGGGKGAAPMAIALENLLGDKIKEGEIVVKYGHDLDLDKIHVHQAAHPVPDAAGLEAAQLVLETARKCDRDDLLICLLTGGASALLPAPVKGVSLEDLQKLTSLLLASGATIEEINIIRKHLSILSGGRLAESANGAGVIALIVSDVLGDDPASIASGPASPDPSTFSDCVRIIEKYSLQEKIPPQILEYLQDGEEGKQPETPKPDNPIFKKVENIVIASNRQAIEAAAAKSAKLGFDTSIMEKPMQGEAALCAQNLLKQAHEIQASLKPHSRPVCLLTGGETTVSLSGNGKGGRNQEMALAASILLEGMDGFYCLFAGTDGTDGPTDAAGGFADNESVNKMGGLQAAQAFLANHDSYEALKKAGDHLITGPTRTNVMDIAIILIMPVANPNL